MQIRKACTLILLFIITGVTTAQENVKRIAILEPVDKANSISYSTKILLRQSITYAITQTPGYEGYNRIDMTKVMEEQEFQRTGYVSDTQIKKLGIMTGAAYVLIAEVAHYDSEHIIILANIVNVETGQIENSSIPIVAGTDPENMAKSCTYLAEVLLNRHSHATHPTSSQNSTTQLTQSLYPIRSDKNYVETAMDVNISMVWVDGGEFMMGCTNEQSDCREDEKNIRRISVEGFYIGRFEVTQAQWTAIMGTSVSVQREKTNYYKTYGVGAEYPIYYVSWEEAMEFCRVLSNKTGRKYTLPTEIQWEYAARGGIANEGTKFAGSNTLDDVAWYTTNSFSTHQCGEKHANALGLFDMSGNVAEWCKDWYPNSSKRVRRGGSWEDSARACRVSNRSSEFPDSRIYSIGFRIVCIP